MELSKMDLRTLSRTPQPQDAPADASADSASRVPTPRRRWLARIVVPVVVLLAFLSLIGYATRDLILPATPVDVVRATALSQTQSAGVDAQRPITSNAPASVVAQAPGWVEPDPYPIYVSALTDGVVNEILVLEGDIVEAGQPLVRMVQDDAQLALSIAQAELARREAVLNAAQTDYHEPVALERAQSVAEAGVAGTKAALIKLDAEITKEEARLAELAAAYERLAEMNERSVSVLQVEAAKYQMQSQRALVEATRQQRPQLEAELNAAQAEHTAAKRKLELKVQLQERLDEAKAELRAVQTQVAEAELRLERMTLKSPIDGVVMARLVSPGAKLMLGMDNPHSAHAIHLYDPQMLQVRVDVPLSDAAAVGLGQRAKIVVDVLPDFEFDGTVTRLVHQADIAKNTVQFKVAIEAPSALLKPDMLARVKFLGTGSAPNVTTSASVSAGTTRIAIEQTAIVQGDQPAVWWVSPLDRRIQRRSVTIGTELGDGRVIIREGLNPGDVIVNQPDDTLQENQRVRY